MRRPVPRRPLVALGLGALFAGLAGCSSPSSSAPATTLPPLPPAVVAYVTTIGAGSSAGLGSHVVALDLSAPGDFAPESIPTGTFPAAIAISAPLDHAYVANYASDSVTPIDLRTDKAGKAIAAGPGPAGIAITPDGKTAYVTDAGSSPIGHTVTPIDLVHHKALAPITVGAGPEGIAITPDGTRAYVADSGAIVSGQVGSIGDTVTPIDLVHHKALAPITVGNAPEAIAISADGSTAYVANANSQSVSPIDVATDTAGTPIGTVGSPQALAMSTDGGTLWAATVGAQKNSITPIDVSGGTAGTPVAVPADPTAIAVHGEDAYVVSYKTDRVVSVDLATRTVRTAHAVSVPGGPYAIALSVVPQAELPKGLVHPGRAGKHAAHGHHRTAPSR